MNVKISITGRPLSDLPGYILEDIKALGIEVAEIKGVYVDPRTGEIKITLLSGREITIP